MKWALRLLGLALLIGPILIAFGMNNWDLKAAVIPSEDEISQVTGQITGIFGDGFSQDTFTIGNPTVIGTNVILPITFKSPLSVPIRINDISVTVVDQGTTLGQLNLEEGVDVPVDGTVSFDLVGTYSGPMPSDPQIGGMNLNIEVYGVTVQVNMGMEEG